MLQACYLVNIEINLCPKNHRFTGLCQMQDLLLREDNLPLRPIRRKLSQSCPLEAGVVGCCAVWGQGFLLPHLKEDCGTVPAVLS